MSKGSPESCLLNVGADKASLRMSRLTSGTVLVHALLLQT